MFNSKLRLLFSILGPLFILAGLLKIFSPTASTVLFALGAAQLFFVIIKGGG